MHVNGVSVTVLSDNHAAYGLEAVAVYPPLRKAIERETKHLHAKIDHVIKHSEDVPAFNDSAHGFEPKS